MRLLRVDLGSGGRCELHHWTEYRGASSKADVDAFLRASLPDLATARGDSLARRNALSFIQFHRLGTAADDLVGVLKDAVRLGQVIAVIEPPRAERTAELADSKKLVTAEQAERSRQSRERAHQHQRNPGLDHGGPER